MRVRIIRWDGLSRCAPRPGSVSSRVSDVGTQASSSSATLAARAVLSTSAASSLLRSMYASVSLFAATSLIRSEAHALCRLDDEWVLNVALEA